VKIAESNVLMAATTTSSQSSKKNERLTAWVDSERTSIQRDRLTVSREAKACLKEAKTDDAGLEAEECNKYRAVLDELLVEILSGRKVRLLDMSKYQKDETPPEAGQCETDTESGVGQERVGWGIEYTQETFYSEEARSVFVAGGIIRTDQGGEIDFSFRLDMQRTFTAHDTLNLRLGDAKLKDPLVVNFQANACSLSDGTFAFDLDCDGRSEALPLLGPESGFLALDRNGDGVVTNGDELFGPRTGDGFSELRGFDEDRDGWIDENDAVYGRLSIWTMGHDGGYSLAGLKQKEIGAIYLGNVNTPFDIKGNTNQLEGKVRSTGIFLTDNGIPGTVQQLDLAV
jgi:hypothetical protein